MLFLNSCWFIAVEALTQCQINEMDLIGSSSKTFKNLERSLIFKVVKSGVVPNEWGRKLVALSEAG